MKRVEWHCGWAGNALDLVRKRGMCREKQEKWPEMIETNILVQHCLVAITLHQHCVPVGSRTPVRVCVPQ